MIHENVANDGMDLMRRSTMYSLGRQAAGSTFVKGVQSDEWESFQRQREQSARDGEYLNGHSASRRGRALDEKRKMEESRVTSVVVRLHGKKKHSESHSHSHCQPRLVKDDWHGRMRCAQFHESCCLGCSRCCLVR